MTVFLITARDVDPLLENWIDLPTSGDAPEIARWLDIVRQGARLMCTPIRKYSAGLIVPGAAAGRPVLMVVKLKDGAHFYFNPAGGWDLLSHAVRGLSGNWGAQS